MQLRQQLQHLIIDTPPIVGLDSLMAGSSRPRQMGSCWHSNTTLLCSRSPGGPSPGAGERQIFRGGLEYSASGKFSYRGYYGYHDYYEEVFVAIPSASLAELDKILWVCQQIPIKVRLFQFSTVAYTRVAHDSPQRGEDRESPSSPGLNPALNSIRL